MTRRAVASEPSLRAALPSVTAAVRELVSIRDLMRYAVSRMNRAGLSFGHGHLDATAEAASLIEWSLDLPAGDLTPWLDARLSRVERQAIVSLIDRRCRSRQPLAYLTGQAWLAGVAFRSDSRALVPRSLIAECLQTTLDDWCKTDPARVLDLCTGGGSLAVLAALRWPQALIIGSDSSADALALAAENLADHGLSDRVTLIESDLFGQIPAQRFDLVLCNPPYVNAASMARLPAEYRAEPERALAAGADGMDLIRRIIRTVGPYLSPEGALLLEIGHEADFFEAAFPTLEFSYLPVTQGERMLVWVTRKDLLRAAPRRR